MAERVSSLLRRSVDHLAQEVPASYELTLRALGALVVALDVDGEQFGLTGGHRLVVADTEPGRPDVCVRTSRATILDVLDAHIGLQSAIESGTVHVQGALDDVVRLHDTLRAYVHAAVRAPAQGDLLDALRAAS